MTRDGQPFPQRDLIVFLAFSVILATLVLQGLTLPPLIRAFDLQDDGEAEREERKARIHAARAAIADLELRDAQSAASVRHRTRWSNRFVRATSRRSTSCCAINLTRRRARRTSARRPARCPFSLWIQRMRLDGLDAERRAIIELRDRGEIGDEVLHKIERELDLEESRLK